MIAGRGKGGQQGNWQRAKSRMREYACMRQEEGRNVCERYGERQELGDHKSCRIFTFVSLSDIPAHRVQITWYVLC